MDDLDPVTVGIPEIEGPGAVAMRARLRLEDDVAALEKGRPSIDVCGGADDQPQMIERSRHSALPLLPGACQGRAMQGQVVCARAEIDIVGVGLPLDVEPEKIDVEPLHGGEIPSVEREMAKACVRGSIHGAKL